MPADLILTLTIVGFWLTNGLKKPVLKEAAPISNAHSSGRERRNLHTVDSVYPLEEIQSAVAHAMGGRRRGKFCYIPTDEGLNSKRRI